MSRSRRSVANDKHRALWCILEVGSLKFGVYLVDRAKFPEVREDVGYFDAEAGVILIGWDLDPELAENTLVHELTHAALFANGVHVEREEEMVNLFSSHIYDALKRNGMLVFPPRPETP